MSICLLKIFVCLFAFSWARQRIGFHHKWRLQRQSDLNQSEHHNGPRRNHDNQEHTERRKG